MQTESVMQVCINANLHCRVCNAKSVMQNLQSQILTDFALQILTDFALQLCIYRLVLCCRFALQICITESRHFLYYRFALQICTYCRFVLHVCITNLYYKFCSLPKSQICIADLHYRFAMHYNLWKQKIWK